LDYFHYEDVIINTPARHAYCSPDVCEVMAENCDVWMYAEAMAENCDVWMYAEMAENCGD
jgi:hypothetical protein